jgi:hypothetical protein
VIDKIEEVFERVTDALLNDRNEISITLKPRRPTKESAIDITDDREGDGRTRQISFPGKTEEEAWKFGTHASGCFSTQSRYLLTSSCGHTDPRAHA